MTWYGECPLDKPKCEKEKCKYYNELDIPECSLQTCDSCRYYNDGSGNCSITGDWVDRSNYCKDGDFYNPYARLI
jgi:hypothetical protein